MRATGRDHVLARNDLHALAARARAEGDLLRVQALPVVPQRHVDTAVEQVTQQRVLVVDGRAVLSTTDQVAEITLAAGDAARGVETSGATLRSDAGDGPAEVLIWAMNKALGEP